VEIESSAGTEKPPLGLAWHWGMRAGNGASESTGYF